MWRMYHVTQASKMEESLQVNMTEAEIQEKYPGSLEPVMRGALCNLIAKVNYAALL